MLLILVGAMLLKIANNHLHEDPSLGLKLIYRHISYLRDWIQVVVDAGTQF
ncbi:hypothetical protein ACT691_05335 [Vibrio metschnikovii]